MRLIVIVFMALAGAVFYFDKFASEDQRAMVDKIAPVSATLDKAKALVNGVLGGEDADDASASEDNTSDEDDAVAPLTEEDAAAQAALRARLPEAYTQYADECGVGEATGAGLSMLYLKCMDADLFFDPSLPGFAMGNAETLEGNPVLTLYNREEGATIDSLLPDIMLLSEPLPDTPIIEGCRLAITDYVSVEGRDLYELMPSEAVLAEWAALIEQGQQPENDYPCGQYGHAADVGGVYTFELIGSDRFAMVHWGNDFQYYLADTLALIED